MKVLLLRPDSKVPAAPPPIGLAYLAGYLRKYAPQHQVQIYDGRVKLTPPEYAAEVVEEFKPDLVGITAFSMEAEPTHALAKAVKKAGKGIPVVLGGPYPSSDPEDALDDENIDFLVAGEGELTFKRLLEAIENGSGFEEIGGLHYRSNGKMRFTGAGETHRNPDEIPFPAWDMVNLEDYFRPSSSKRRLTNPLQMRKRGMSVFSSRGCPYGCTYCHNLFGRRFRTRSPENIIAELKWLKEEFRVEEIEFIDDVFNLDLERAKRIMSSIIEEGLDFKISFPNGLRADRMDEELIDLMKRAGCYRINYAVESGSGRIQKVMKKRLNLKRAQEVIDYTALKNISIGGFFMLGFPTESEEEMRETVEFALKSRCHTASFFILTPFPGTEIYREAESAGFNMKAYYSDYGAVSANLSRASSEKILELRRSAFRRFYFNPRRIWSIFRTTPNKLALARNFFRTARLSFLGKEY